MIAVTEVNRAMSRAAFATYKAHGLREWDLVTAADPCPICAAESAANPHSMQSFWLLPPRHPFCRCSAAPVVRGRDVPGVVGGAVRRALGRGN